MYLQMSETLKRKKLGILVKEKRLRTCLSQEVLAQQVLVSKDTIAKVEQGRGIPNGWVLLKIMDKLNISVEEMLNV